MATIGETAGMVGHDIRIPLEAMTSDVYLAKSDLNSLPDGQEEVVQPKSERTTTTNLTLPTELPRVEESLRTLSAALKALETPGLDQAEVPAGIQTRIKL